MDEVVCAIPLSQENWPLRDEAHKYVGVLNVFGGTEDDVLNRYHSAAEHYEADIIIRITGDCPLISPMLCNAVLCRLTSNGADYASNILPRTFPRGLDCEVFTMDLLERAHVNTAIGLSGREHVTPYMQNHHGIYRENVTSPWPMEGRLCIDTQDDYNVVKAYFDESRQHLRAA